MSKIFAPEQTPEQRLRMLHDHADRVEETKYYRDLSEEELIIRKSDYVENSIQLGHKQDELQVIKDRFKAEMAPFKEKNEQLIQSLKTKMELTEGKLFYIADQETGIMEIYTATGELHDVRKLRPEERQARIFVQSGVVANGE